MRASSNLSKLMNENEAIDNPLFHCFVCDVCVNSKDEWILHANGQAHIVKEPRTLTICDGISDIRLKVISQSKHLLADQNKFVEIETEGNLCTFSCVLCDIKIMSYFALGDHLENGLHKTKVRAYQSLKEGKGIHTSGTGSFSSKESENIDMRPVGLPKKDDLTGELRINSESITNAVTELHQFFSGTLKCLNCHRSMAVDPTIVSNHLKSCFLESSINQSVDSEIISIKDKFTVFLRTAQNTSQLDGLQLILNRPFSQCDKLNQRVPAAIFRNLQTEIARTSIVSPQAFKCLECDLTGNINKWEDHLIRCHFLSPNEPRIDHDSDSIVCVCTLCRMLFFGSRKIVVKHEHFLAEHNGLFFLFSSYPQLKSVLDCNYQLPRYYRFLQRLRFVNDRHIAFYCLACNFYSLEKSQKHFESKDHQSKNHPMFEFFYCAVCSILFFTDRQLFEDHRRTPWHVFSKSTVKSNAIRASVDFVSKGHEDLLSSIKADVYKYWRLQPMNNVYSFAFWCELCAYRTNKKEEWRNFHLTSEIHVAQMKQKECFEHMCTVCKVSLFGSVEFQAAHFSSEGHKNIKTKVYRDFNRRRMAKKRTSVRLQAEDILKEQLSNSTPQLDAESSEKSENDDSEPEPLPEPVRPLENPALVYDEKSYDLENNPYTQKLNYFANADKKLIKEFLERIVRKHGPFGRVKSFFCAFCNYYSSEKSWWPHIESPEHQTVLFTYSSDAKVIKNKQLCIMFCSECLNFGLGDQIMRKIHTSSKSHKKMCAKVKSGKNTISSYSPISFLSTTDDDEENLHNGNGIQRTASSCFVSDVTVIPTASLDGMNSSEEEKNEVENVEDELYEMVMREESDLEKIVISDDELDRSVLKKVKDNVTCNTNAVEETDRDENEVENRENMDVEYSIVVSGIPGPIMKNRALLKQTFARYVEFDRTFVKKNKPGSIYLVVSKDLEDSFKRLKENLVHLIARWGTDELTVHLNTEEKSELAGIREHLLDPAILLFSNRRELMNAVIHMINRYDAEANCVTTKRRIHELQTVISELASRIYRNYNVIVKTHVFGSRVTGLAAENSDVDIYLQIGPSFRGLISNNVDLQQQLVVLFSKEMRCHSCEFCDITSIPFARVPIVKFKHIKSNLNCDLSFKSGLSTMNSILVKTYLELDERIKFIVCAVKLWMKLNELADRNLFTTYAQIWMVLFFLMQADIAVVPTVIKLKNMLPLEQQILTVEGWNCSFPNIRNIVWRSSCKLTGEELLYKFFLFYSNISLSNYVLCTLTGLKLEKKHFIKYYDSLPEIFRTFKLRITEDRILFRKVSNDFESFCVQDPFDHCHNLTKTINIRKFTVFVELCKQTAELLKR